MDAKKSLDFQQRAKKIIPGWTQLLSKRPDQFSAGVWPGYFKKASGVHVWDLDGNAYVDMSISGIGANVLGYADADVDAAVIAAIRDGSSSSLNCYEEVELAERLCALHNWAGGVRFARTGGESMAIAVRIARAHSRRSVVAVCGYHGWHDWYLAANLKTKDALNDHLLKGLEPLGVPAELAGTTIPFRFNDAAALEALGAQLGDRLAAIILEPIRNERPSEAFKSMIENVRKKTGAVLVVDEISSGFRIAKGGAHEMLGYRPDIAVFSKALGNGYPIGAVIGKTEVMEAASQTFISSTCWTERVGYAAALATIEKFVANRAHEHLVKIGDAVQAGWKKAAQRCGLSISVSGISPLSHFSFDYANALEMKAYFVQLMLDKGFLASTLFYSMFAHKLEHVEAYLAAVETAFSEIKRAQDSGSVASKLRGKAANSGFLRLN